MSEVELKIKSLLEKKVKIPYEYRSNLNLINDLAIDSVEMLELIIELEDSFDVVFDDAELDINIISCLDKLTQLIESKLN